MSRYLAKLACVAAALIGVAASAYGQEAVLRYRWVQGDEVRYRYTQKSSTAISGLPTGDAVIDQTNVQVLRLRVENVASDGTVTLRETFESIRMEQMLPTGSVVFDSTSPEKPADPISETLANTMSAMVGESVIFVLAPNGSVIKVEGMSRIMDKTFGSLPQSPLTIQLLTQLKASMSDEAMGRTLGEGFSVFPDRPLKAGDTWTREFEMNAPFIGKATTSTTYTLKAVEPLSGTSVARIAVTLAMKLDGASDLLRDLGATATFGDTKSDGEIVFDIAGGRLHKSSTTMEMPIAVSMKGSPIGPIDLKGIVKSSMLMELVEK